MEDTYVAQQQVEALNEVTKTTGTLSDNATVRFWFLRSYKNTPDLLLLFLMFDGGFFLRLGCFVKLCQFALPNPCSPMRHRSMRIWEIS